MRIDSVKRALAHDTAVDLNGRRARLLILLASLIAQGGKTDDARQFFMRASSRPIDLTIRNCDRMAGTGWIRASAKKAVAEAEGSSARRLQDPQAKSSASLAVSHRNLGMLRLEQGDLRSASALLDALWWTPKTAGGEFRNGISITPGAVAALGGKLVGRMPTFNWPWSLPAITA